jgi:hypothetical protein
MGQNLTPGSRFCKSVLTGIFGWNFFPDENFCPDFLIKYFLAEILKIQLYETVYAVFFCRN